ncbi:hypothetical protein [Amycolatopsis minnesotensis]|uniref:Uncharacterized protein n=1 Tax=Amycolatopsis minnesotensis TaxID=337894 RepID=A0ABP5DU53_9PSEU
MDMGLENPAALEALARAVSIIDGSVERLCDEISELPFVEDSEVGRLARALPPGPISFDRTIISAADAVRGTLDQVSHIVRTNTPTSPIVLYALSRAALVGAGRVVFALLPADPATRLRNARVLLAQEAKGFTQALDCYAGFEQFSRMKPEAQYLAAAQRQKAAIQEGNQPPGDGKVMYGAAEVVAAALEAMPGDADGSRKALKEHFIWLWNTYSGVAHAHAWPRLLPGSGQDRRIPGDFPSDLHMIATTAHVAMLSFKLRHQPGSANTTKTVPLTSEPG